MKTFYNLTQSMSHKARAAVYAAKNVKNWGIDAARRYATKHDVSARLFTIAMLCEATKKEKLA